MESFPTAMDSPLNNKSLIPRFGKEIREKYFMYDPNSYHLDHGSFGLMPKPVWEARIRKMASIEFLPGTFYRRALEKQWFHNLQAVASFLGAKEENLVLVESATAGVNAVVKSLNLAEEESILVNSWSYTGCHNACHSATRSAGASLLTWNLQYPINSKEEIIESFDTCLKNNPQIKLAMIDLIAGPTAVMFPIQEMITICKCRGVLVLVDGAHGPGQVEVNLEQLGADFFSGNMHKWLYTPRGCAFLWIHPSHHGQVKPVLTSTHMDHKDFRYDFCHQATRDYSPYLCLADALQFYQEIGGLSTITSYTSSLLEEAADYLSNVWGTRQFPIPSNMKAPNMRLVRLPFLPAYPLGPSQNQSVLTRHRNLMTALSEIYNVHCTCIGIQGEPWVRLSANVHNSMEDYEKLGQCILELMEKPALY